MAKSNRRGAAAPAKRADTLVGFRELREMNSGRRYELRAVPRSGEYGVSGTHNYGGWILGEEYNPDLIDPKAAIVKYDQMRRGDPKIAAILQAIKLPIRGATFTVVPDTDSPDPTDDEIADFCQRAIFGDEAMQESWDFYLRHLLMRLDFGFAVLEKVWFFDEDEGRYRFHRLAPRLQRTIEQWKVDPDGSGKLLEVIQYAPKRNGIFGHLPIPAQYALVSTREREGDNFYGMSVLRSVFKPWFYKNEAERIEMVRLDRFGVGIPVADIQEGYGIDGAELAELETTLADVRSHHRGYLVAPPKIRFRIMVPEGGHGGATGGLEVINYMNDQIAGAVLATFTNDHADGLNSNRARTLADVFLHSLNAEAQDIASDIKTQAIRELCDLNFDMSGGRRYPRIEVSGISDVDLKQLADAIGPLATQGIITPDDDLESFLRKLAKLPPIQEGFSREDNPPPDPAPPQPAPTSDDPDNPNPATSGPANADQNNPTNEPVENADTLALRNAKKVVISGRTYGRQPTLQEQKILALSTIADTLDVERDTLLKRLSTIRRKQLNALAKQAAKLDARPTPEQSDLVPKNFKMPHTAEITKAIRDTQKDLLRFGAMQVRNELIKQGAPISLASRSPAAKGMKSAQTALTTSAKITTGRINDTFLSRVVETAQRIRRIGVQGAELEQKILDALDEEIEMGLKREASQESNEAFSMGRAVSAAEFSDMIEVVVQSSVLDANTCTECEDVDGEEMEFGSDRQVELSPPYSECKGGDGCRCVQLFLFSQPAEDEDDVAAREAHEAELVALREKLAATEAALADLKQRKRTKMVRDEKTGRIAEVIVSHGDDS